MRILAVVQRYGPDIGGGAEQLVRQYAERLAARGHRVEVLTSCATSYLDWATVFPPGTSELEGVTVHRLPARHTRDGYLFNGLHDRASSPAEGTRMAALLSEEWVERVGPSLIGFEDWLDRNIGRFDVVWFSGYMYTPTTRGLPRVAPFRPTVLQSVAHDEPALRLPSVVPVFQHAAGINFLTPEEQELVVRRFRPTAVQRVIGAGITIPDEPLVPHAADRYGVGGRPYVVAVGRIDPGKGVHDLVTMFRLHKQRHPGPLALLLVGEEVVPIGRDPDVVVTGFVSEVDKWSLIDGAQVLIQPSYHESFSLSLVEGWERGVPALVQRQCAVLDGQVRRSQGGFTYRTFAEFDAALTELLDDPALREDLGRRGRAYVARYHWPTILEEFEELLEATIQHHRSTVGRGVTCWRSSAGSSAGSPASRPTGRRR